MMIKPKSPLVTAEWVHKNISELVLLDASIYLLEETQHLAKLEAIPGALFFDLKLVFRDLKNPLPNTIPTVKKFEKSCSEIGIKNTDTLVIYDRQGIYTSPRAWWLFKTMGHKNVYVLNGGLPGWQSSKKPTASLLDKTGITTNYKAILNKHNVKYYPAILANATKSNFCLIDARAEGRFNGTAPEPRADLKSGAIPCSINLPYTEVLENGYYKSTNALKTILNKLDVKSNQELVFSCGSGITACIILLAAELVTDQPKSVFDGSWTEWATKQKLFSA